jgi:hypothetical protein
MKLQSQCRNCRNLADRQRRARKKALAMPRVTSADFDAVAEILDHADRIGAEDDARRRRFDIDDAN